MDVHQRSEPGFSGRYGAILAQRHVAMEDATGAREHLLQCVWYDQLLPAEGLQTTEGHRIRVVSPGYWNRQEGPDFRGAQIEFNGTLHAGDVELHLDHGGWNAHGHHLDPRYEDVILHVVLADRPPKKAPSTLSGRYLPVLIVGGLVPDDLRPPPQDDGPGAPADRALPGACAAHAARAGTAPVEAMLDLAGEWRMLEKARALGERMDRAGADQALYEAVLYACGYSHFKHHFRAIARHLPYDRARQLAREDGLLLETALLQIGGLLPETLPEGTTAVPHFGRLRGLRRDHLEGLRPLPLQWKRVGVRPNNNPERRLAGVARFLARSAGEGISEGLETVWRQDLRPTARRKAFEDLFPTGLGFWATHCTWTGKRLAKPMALIGEGRLRSIVGNVFVPAALALARRTRDRVREEQVLAFFKALPKEPGNHVIERMLPRVAPEGVQLKLNFQRQQGLLQVYQDWCEPNPSCRNCTLQRYLSGSPG